MRIIEDPVGDAAFLGGGLPIVAAHPYAPILVLLLVIMAIVCLIMGLTHVLGPKRRGPTKSATYEAGMSPVGDARLRFNVRFYIVAVLFLLFDVEVVFLWPWAVVFYEAAMTGQPVEMAGEMFDKTFLLLSMGVFFALLVIGFVYEWGKGAFKWT